MVHVKRSQNRGKGIAIFQCTLSGRGEGGKKKRTVCTLLIMAIIGRRALVINLKALFWSFQMRLHLWPQQRMPYWMCGTISALYIIKRISRGKYRFNLDRIPAVLDIFDDILFIWASQDIFWSRVTPRKLKFVTRSMKWLFIWRFGIIELYAQQI